MTIRGRLLTTLLPGLAIVLAIGGAALYWIERSSMVRQFDAGLEARAHTVASLIKLEPVGLVFETGDAPAATLAETYYELHTASDELLKRSRNLGDESLPLRSVEDEGALAFEDVDLPGGVAGRAAWLAFRPRVDDDDWERVPADQRPEPELLVVIAAIDRSVLDRSLGTLLGALVLVGCVLGVTVGALVTFGTRWGLAPLARLTRQLEGIDAGSIPGRITDDRAPSELAPVYRELNGMLDRVERTLERERSFADAAAHELRTPLSELRAVAEVALKWPDEEKRAAVLADILEIGREMEWLVESLLLISRGHAVDAAVEASDSGGGDALAGIIDRCLAQSREEIAQKHLAIAVNVDGHVPPSRSAEAIEIILRNLIGNAVHYTPGGGEISIRVEADGHRAGSIIVENSPVSLTPDDVTHLFEPFWRTDSARSDRRHVGLGLTVVERVAHAVNLKVEASVEGKILRFTVRAGG